jgi:uncharacterized membrane protein
MADITLLQWVMMYFAGFIFCILVFKTIDTFRGIRYYTRDYTFDVMIMSLGWMVTIPFLIIIGFITLVYKLVEWLLKY